MHISPNLQEILLPHTLMRKPSILRKVPTEVTTIQNLCQQQPPTLLIHWHNQLILRQSKHLLQNIHHRPCELPQSQILQFSLHHIQSSRSRRICSESRTDRSIRSYIPNSIPAVPSRTIWRDLWWSANLRAKRFWAPEGGYIPNPYGRDLGLGYRVRTPSSQEGDRGVETKLTLWT